MTTSHYVADLDALFKRYPEARLLHERDQQEFFMRKWRYGDKENKDVYGTDEYTTADIWVETVDDNIVPTGKPYGI